MARVSLQLKVAGAQQQVARFGRCIVNLFGYADGGEGRVGLQLPNNQLLLHSLDDKKDEDGVTLRHAFHCPAFHLAADDLDRIPTDIKTRGVGIGVVVLLTSSDDRVLLTRRAEHMRTFPGTWVPPGGHIELDETLEEAGRRELREETGLDLGSEPPSGVLGLWESVYPHRLDYGQPLRQHLVVYLWMRSQLTWKQLNQQLKLDPDETDSALWLPTSLIDSITRTGADSPAHHRCFWVDAEDGATGESSFGDDVLEDTTPPPPGATIIELERLTWGTRYALHLWFKWIREAGSGPSKL